MDKTGERLNMLQRNNQQLSAELARVREENQRLEASLSELRTKQVEYGDTVAAVDRVWTQLTQDMAFLVQRSRGFPETLKEEAPAQEVKMEEGDPFLRRLVGAGSAAVDAKDLKKKLEEMADDATEVEKALVPRCVQTFNSLALLLEQHDKQVASCEAAVKAALEGGGVDAKAEVLKLNAEAVNLRREVDAQKARSRTAEAQLRQLTDMLQKDEASIQELTNELSDRKEELNAANRKLHTLKESAEGGLISQPSLPTALGRRKSSSPAPGDLISSGATHILEKEVKSEQERADSLAKQLRELQAKIQDETFIFQTGAFQMSQRQVQAQGIELEKARKMVEGLQRECESYKHSIHGLMQQAEDGRHQRRLVQLTEERILDLEQQITDARNAQESAEMQLEAERRRKGEARTVQELQGMVEVLEKEALTNRGNASKRQALLAEVEAAKQAARTAASNSEAKEAEMKVVGGKLAKAQTELTVLKTQEKELKGVSEDLRVFVEVLQSFCDDPRELAEVRSSESKLKAQLSAVQKQLKSHELQIAVEAAKKLEAQAQSQAEELQREKVALELEASDLRRQCADLQQKASTLSADIEAYTTEMEVVGTAYEDMQAKNSRLLQQLAEKDGAGSQLLTEKIQCQHQAVLLAGQRTQAEAARKLAEQQATVLQERVLALEARLQERMNELGQALERATTAGQQAEKLSCEVRERDAALKQRDSQLATSQSAAEQRKRALDEEAEKLHREKSRRVRLEEENKVLQSRVDRGEAEASSATANDDLRLRVRCQVCQVRTKDTVITKCWHTFCGDCIRRNLEARNRKCPTCGHLFGAPDVKQIYL